MALGNFIKTVWSANIMQALQKSLVFGGVANRNYEGQVNNLGDKVRVLQLSDITIASYTKSTTVTPAEVDDAAMELIADQAYYFAFKTSDVEAVQQKAQVLADSTAQAAYGFRDQADQYLAGLYAQAGLNSYSTGTTPWDVTSLNVEDVLLDAKEKMARLPKEGRFIIVPEWFHTKLIIAGLATKTSNDNVFANGMVDRVLGFDVYLSENVSQTSATTGDHAKIFAGIKGQSMSFADAIVNIEAYRVEAGFHDAVKGLYVFGGKIMRPDMTLVIHADKTAEAS